MLEAIRSRAEGWLVKVILALLVIPFALWGVGSYIHFWGNHDTVAAVDGYAITHEAYGTALKAAEQRLLAELPPDADVSTVDTAALRRSVLDELVNQYLVLRAARKARLRVPDQQLVAMISQVPAFQQDGHFSRAQYEAALSARNLTPLSFESNLRNELVVAQLMGVATSPMMISRTVSARFRRLMLEERRIAEVDFSPQALAASINVTQAAEEAYYAAHRQEFRVPRRVRIQYLVLSPQTLLGQISVSDAAVKQYYQDHLKTYQKPEERRASHILIALPSHPTPAQVEAARAKALRILAQVRAHPSQFAALARKYSDDSGTAAQGGDLGFFARADMVKPFSDAVFSMALHQIAGPVQSPFGFHIIELTGIQPATTEPLDAVRGEILNQLRAAKAQEKFDDVADHFTNLVYERFDSLQPAAADLGLTVQTSSGWIEPDGTGAGNPVLSSKKFLRAVFSPDALIKRRNTDAIDVGNNTLVSGRVLAYQPAFVEPFAQVQARIVRELKLKGADALAQAKGRQMLARLRAGQPATVAFGAAKTVTRRDSLGLDPAELQEVFKADATHLPAYVGAPAPQGGYALFRIDAVTQPKNAADPQLEEMLNRALGNAYAQAYIAALRQQASIKIEDPQALKPARQSD